MRLSLIVTSLLLSPFASAHPGHDHSHWISEPIHLITLSAIASVLFLGGWAIRNSSRKLRTRIKQQEK